MGALAEFDAEGIVSRVVNRAVQVGCLLAVSPLSQTCVGCGFDYFPARQEMLLRRGLAATAAGGTAAAAFGYYKARTTMGEDALSRMMSYNVVAVPAILQYKAVEARYEKAPKLLPALFSEISEDELTRRYESLHHTHARPLFNKFMELGGFYYKTGQKVATNLGGMSPKIYVDMFQPFLDRIPPRDFASVRRVIEEELGRPMGEVFASFEEAPLGCASIGQVHRATLRATGERVVVKVQNPEAERTFRGDVFALKVLIDFFAPQISVAFDEIAKQVEWRAVWRPALGDWQRRQP